MTRAGGLALGALAAWLAGLAPGTPIVPGPVRPAEANGVTQREIQGRVESVDAAAGTIVVARAFRGKTTRLTLRAGPALQVFACADGRAGLDRVKAGMVVSAFYELVGSDGVVNLLVVEPPP
jgi:hypothetical protein